jgi:preprotein translocase subunit SecY
MTAIQNIFNSLRNTEIRKRIFFTFAMLLVFRILAAITTPGIPRDALMQLFGEGNFGDLMTAVSGAAFENASIVAIGLGPYINASVILQLLGSIVPKLEQLQEEGERGRAIINQYTRILTVPLSILQSFVIYSILRGQGIVTSLQPLELITMISSMTAGSMILVWLGELIQESGIGNGSSVIIFAGIMSSLPGNIAQNFGVVNPKELIQV